jgi:hypothetical protein
MAADACFLLFSEEDFFLSFFFNGFREDVVFLVESTGDRFDSVLPVSEQETINAKNAIVESGIRINLFTRFCFVHKIIEKY